MCVLTVTMEAASGDAPMQAESPVLTLSEAAALLRIEVDELARLAEQNELPARRVGSSWRFNRASLLAWLNGDWVLVAATAPSGSGRSSLAAPPPGSPIASGGLAELTATGMAGGQAQGSSPQTPADAQANPIGEAPDERNAEDIFLRGQRVLLAPGQVVLDMGQFYTRSASLQLASVAESFGLASVEQATLTTLFLGRVGIFNETELFVGSAFHVQKSQAFLGSSEFAGSDRRELGGVGVGIRRTLLREGPGRPDIIASFDAQIPTGDIPYGVGGALVFVKSVDPVVLFANAGYRHSFMRGIDTATRAPEHRVDVSVGYGLGLNDTLAISTAVSGVFTGAGMVDRSTSRRANVYSLRFALTSWLAEGLYIEPSVSFGLSGSNESVAMGVTIPYAF
jgi:excisionase family DNA binding protein